MALFSETVPRSMYEDAVADRRQAHAQLATMIPASVHSEAITRLHNALELAQETARQLGEQLAALKRHDIGLAPKDFDPASADPMKSLGPKTQLAIEDFAAGDPSTRSYLIGRAHLEQAALRAKTDDPAEIDAQLAAMIAHGDQ